MDCDTHALFGGISPRDNDLGVDLAAILALATGRRAAFANVFPIRYADADWRWFLELGHAFDGELYGPVEGDTGARIVTILRALVALPERPALALG